MKKLLLLLLLYSCNSHDDWQSSAGRAYQTNFMRTCSDGTWKGENYCECVLNKIMNKYSGPFDSVNEQYTDAAGQMAYDCYDLYYY